MGIRSAAAIAVAALALSGCRKAETVSAEAKAPAAAAVSLSVLRVKPQPFAASVAITGSLVSNARVDVKAETTGRLTRFPKQEGERVAAGEAIAWVDEENYKLAIRQAESAVMVAKAVLERMHVLEAHGKAESERAQNLIKSGGITDKDYKMAQVTEQEARSQVLFGEAQLEQAQTALEVAKKRLRDAVIHAPVAGEIQKKYVNEGAYVEPPTAVATLVDNNQLELESLAAASELGPVRRGQKVVFTVSSFPGERFEGRVIEIAPAMDADSRSAKVRISVAGDGKLKAGMFAEGEILTGTEQAIVAPVTALYRDEQSAKDSAVFVVENGKATRRAVKIGRERDGSAEILSGLKAGEVIVAEQSIQIAEGTAVAAREANRVSQ
jgi:RND family efflux transporter MFP subunit